MQRAPIGALCISSGHHRHWPAFTPPPWPGIGPPLTVTPPPPGNAVPCMMQKAGAKASWFSAHLRHDDCLCSRLDRRSGSEASTHRLEGTRLLPNLRGEGVRRQARSPWSWPGCSIRAARRMLSWPHDSIGSRERQRICDIVEKLNDAGAGLRSLAEPWADTTSPAGRMVLTVFAGIAEFERALIHQRTSSGRIAAKARSVRFGRPPKLTIDRIALGERLVGEAPRFVKPPSRSNVITPPSIGCCPSPDHRALRHVVRSRARHRSGRPQRYLTVERSNQAAVKRSWGADSGTGMILWI